MYIISPVTEETQNTANSSLVSSVEGADEQEKDLATSESKEGQQDVQELTTEVSIEDSSLTTEEKELFHKMMEVGVFYGRSKSRTNPLMKKYVLTTRSGFEVIDLQSTIKELNIASNILREIVKSGGTAVFVGTSPAVKKIVKETAERLEMPYVTERWLGGTFTNFETITKRVKYFTKLKEDKASGKLEKYTKKEQLKMDKELAKLNRLFLGIEKLERLPDVIFITDLNENEYAAKEAKQKNIPVVAILNTDSNLKLVDYPIPANDRNSKSVEIIMNFLEKVIADAKIEGAKIKADADKKEENKKKNE